MHETAAEITLVFVKKCYPARVLPYQYDASFSRVNIWTGARRIYLFIKDAHTKSTKSGRSVCASMSTILIIRQWLPTRPVIRHFYMCINEKKRVYLLMMHIRNRWFRPFRMYINVLQWDILSMIIFKVRKFVRFVGHIALMQRKNNLMLLIRKGPILVLLQTASHRRVRDNAFVLRQPPVELPFAGVRTNQMKKHFSPAEKSVFHFHKAARNFRRALARGSVSRARSFCVVNLFESPRRTPDRFWMQSVMPQLLQVQVSFSVSR